MKKQFNMLILTLLLAVFLGGCGSGGSGDGGSNNVNPVEDNSVGAGSEESNSSAKAITAFSLGGAVGIINETAKSISVTLPLSTNLTSLVATFTTTGVSVKVGENNQTSGQITNDFTNPLTYIVIAGDGTTAGYTVTVTLATISAKVFTADIDGGTFASSDNKVKFNFVPRALLSDTEIKITTLNTFPLDTLVIPGTVYEFEPDGILFNGQVELTITYDPNTLPSGLDENDIVVGKLINGSWQALFGSRVDTNANTVTIPVRGFSTYGLMNSKRVNTLYAYVVTSPATENEFSDIGSASTYLCQKLQSGQKGAVITKKSPVTIGTLNIACDIEFRTDDNTTPSIEGSATINSSAPVSFVGLTFTGGATFNTGDDLTLISNTFQDLNINPGTAGIFASPKLKKSRSFAPDGACFDGNTSVKDDTVAGTLTVGGGAKVCGDTSIQNGEIKSFVADGTVEFGGGAKLDVNGSLIKSIAVEGKYSGSAETTIASIQGNDASTFKMHLLDGDIKLNQLNHDISGSVKVETDGVADLTLNQKELNVGGNFDIDTSEMGLNTKSYYNANLTVDGNATLKVGGSMDGKIKDTTFKGTATTILGANAKEGTFDHAGVDFKGEARHNLLTDEAASHQLNLIVKGNASTTYERGLGTCVNTGASARIEYTNTIIKQAGFESVGAGLFMVGKTSCGGQLQKPSQKSGNSIKRGSFAPDAGEEIIIRDIIFPDKVQQEGINIKDMDIPVTIDNNKIKAELIGITVKNVSKKVLINNNTIDAIGGVSLTNLPDATFSNNSQSDDVGVMINMEPVSGASITRIAVTNNTFLNFGSIVGGPFGTTVITATGNTLYDVEAPWDNVYLWVQGNTFTGGIDGASVESNRFLVDPGRGNNPGLDDELDIGTLIDWTGNGCGDYPPSSDHRDDEGLCILGEGIPVPTAP